MYNLVVNDTAIIKASEDTPNAIRLYFDEELGIRECISVEKVVTYWADATPITGSFDLKLNMTWSDEHKVVTVRANFDDGSFYGDLLHHNAIGIGDDSFKIGLVRLLNEGYSPKTQRGKGVSRADVSPICIEFVYDEEVSSPLDNTLRNIRLKVMQAENRTLRNSFNRLRNILVNAIEEVSQYI